MIGTSAKQMRFTPTPAIVCVLKKALLKNVGSSSSLYAHGGATWPVSTRRLGFDVRYLDADEFMAWGVPFPVGYVQVALVFVW